MKRILLLIFLIAAVALVLFLFKPPTRAPFVINQMSEHAIVNFNDRAEFETFLEHGLKIVSPHAKPQTIVKIAGDEPISISNLTIESPGEVLLIGTGGVVVGENAHLNWNTSEDPMKLLPPENGGGYVEVGNLQTSAEVIKDGNIYALAINRGGKIQATKSKSTVRKPTTFDFPDLDESPIISDE